MIEKDLWGFNVIGKQGVDAKNDFAVNPTANGTDISVRFNNTEISGAQFATLKEIAEGGGTGVSNYNDLTNIPIINADLEAENFVPVAGKYYRHVVAGGPQPAGTPIVAGVTSLYVDKEFTGQAMKDYLASLSYPYTPGTGLAMCKFFDTTFGDYVGYWGAGYAEFEGQSAYLMGFFDAESSELLSVLWASIEATGVEEPMNWCDPIRESADGKLSENVTVSNIQSGDWNGKVFSSTQFVTSTFVDGTIYQCTAASPAAYAQVLTSADSVGTQVIANPGGVLSANLQSIAINGVSYGIAAGGSGEGATIIEGTLTWEEEDPVPTIAEADVKKIINLVKEGKPNIILHLFAADIGDFSSDLWFTPKMKLNNIYPPTATDGQLLFDTTYAGQAIITLNIVYSTDDTTSSEFEYEIGAFTTGIPEGVEANPSGEASETLSSIKIGDTKYSIGGGSGDSLYVDLGEYALTATYTDSGYLIGEFAPGVSTPSYEVIRTAVDAGKIPVLRFNVQYSNASRVETRKMIYTYTEKIANDTDAEVTYYFCAASGTGGYNYNGARLIANEYGAGSYYVQDWDIHINY